MRRNAPGFIWLITLTVVAAFFSGWMGWLNGSNALDIAMGTLSLVGLWVVLWLPWDLYFAAKELALEQDESASRGIDIAQRDRDLARRVAPKLLATSIGLHLIGAGTVAIVTWLSNGRLGYLFAGFYILGMGLRPLGAGYKHMRRRLAELRQRARYPREDVLALRDRMELAESALKRVQETELPLLTESDQKLEESLTRREDEARIREGRYEKKVDKVLLEFERSMAKLTEDRELLQGIRAFVRVVRQS